MSKIFEALQFAQTERVQLDKLARQLSTEPKDHPPALEPEPAPEVTAEKSVGILCNDTPVLEPAPVPEATTEKAEQIARNNTPVLEPAPVPEVRIQRTEPTECKCEQWSHRIRRQGVWDFLLGLFKVYPWKCAQCHRRFHRLRRY